MTRFQIHLPFPATGRFLLTLKRLPAFHTTVLTELDGAPPDRFAARLLEQRGTGVGASLDDALRLVKDENEAMRQAVERHLRREHPAVKILDLDAPEMEPDPLL